MEKILRSLNALEIHLIKEVIVVSRSVRHVVLARHAAVNV